MLVLKLFLDIDPACLSPRSLKAPWSPNQVNVIIIHIVVKARNLSPCGCLSSYQQVWSILCSNLASPLTWTPSYLVYLPSDLLFPIPFSIVAKNNLWKYKTNDFLKKSFERLPIILWGEQKPIFFHSLWPVKSYVCYNLYLPSNSVSSPILQVTKLRNKEVKTLITG